MYVAGIVPEDAPDPMLEIVDRLRQMPVPILGLVPQPHLEDWGAFEIQTSGSNGVLDDMTAGISYTLWRNPENRADPANLADLDARTRASFDSELPWPRPQWLLDGVERMRYPRLSEAVRTAWFSDPSRRDVRRALVQHVNHVIVNGYGGAYPSTPFARPDSHPLVDERSVESGVNLSVNGASISGVRIDTDPDVFGIGADLGDGGVLTAVIPRDALPMVDLAIATRVLA
jgi:hypothetical protein